REVLTTAIESLPPDYRTAFVMHDMEGLSNPEIAETRGISLPAVKSRVHRFRLFLRQRLSDYMNETSEQSRSCCRRTSPCSSRSAWPTPTDGGAPAPGSASCASSATRSDSSRGAA